jgi:hypothetical protein
MCLKLSGLRGQDLLIILKGGRGVGGPTRSCNEHGKLHKI